MSLSKHDSVLLCKRLVNNFWQTPGFLVLPPLQSDTSALPFSKTLPCAVVQLERVEYCSLRRQSSGQPARCFRGVLLPAPPLLLWAIVMSQRQAAQWLHCSRPGFGAQNSLQAAHIKWQQRSPGAQSAWRIPDKLAASQSSERNGCSHCTMKGLSKWSGTEDKSDSFFSMASLYSIIKLTFKEENRDGALGRDETNEGWRGERTC